MRHSKNRHTKETFRWIVSILKRHKIPHEIIGGFAARLYGTRRILADIDIDIPHKNFKSIFPDINKYIIWGPAKYRDPNWNLWLMTLRYRKQIIDICGAEHTKIFDQNQKKWAPLINNLSKHTNKVVYGMRVPVTTKKELLEYKKKLLRRVDKEDIKELQNKYRK